MFLECASWERGEKRGEGFLQDSIPKIMHPQAPVIQIVAVPLDEKFNFGY